MKTKLYNNFIYPSIRFYFILKLTYAFLKSEIRWLTIRDDSQAYKELKKWIYEKPPKYGIWIRIKNSKTGKYTYQ